MWAVAVYAHRPPPALCLGGDCTRDCLPAAASRRVRRALHEEMVALQLSFCDIVCPRCNAAGYVCVQDDPPPPAPPSCPPFALSLSPPPSPLPPVCCSKNRSLTIMASLDGVPRAVSDDPRAWELAVASA